MITKSSQITPPALTPLSLKGIEDALVGTALVTGVGLYMHVLRAHTDPVVQHVGDNLWELLVPVLKKYGDDFALTPMEYDEYDLVLPSPGERAYIGKDADSTVQMDSSGIQREHIKVQPDLNEDGWVATLCAVQGENDLSMKIGEETIHRRERHGGDDQWVSIKPGDVIEVGFNRIKMHAPQKIEETS